MGLLKFILAIIIFAACGAEGISHDTSAICLAILLAGWIAHTNVDNN